MDVVYILSFGLELSNLLGIQYKIKVYFIKIINKKCNIFSILYNAVGEDVVYVFSYYQKSVKITGQLWPLAPTLGSTGA